MSHSSSSTRVLVLVAAPITAALLLAAGCNKSDPAAKPAGANSVAERADVSPKPQPQPNATGGSPAPANGTSRSDGDQKPTTGGETRPADASGAPDRSAKEDFAPDDVPDAPEGQPEPSDDDVADAELAELLRRLQKQQKPEPVDPAFYSVPDGTPEELMAFIDRVLMRVQSVQSQEEFDIARNAVHEAAQKALGGTLEPVSRVRAAMLSYHIAGEQHLQETIAHLNKAIAEAEEQPMVRLEAYQYLTQLAPDRVEEMRNVANGYLESEDEQLVTVARMTLLNSHLSGLQENPKEGPAALAHTKALIEAVGEDALQDGFTIAQIMETKAEPKVAEEMYDFLASKFGGEGEDDNPRNQQVTDAVAKAKTRLGLLGKPLAIEGTLIDGTPFDWSKYEGQVVLIDFWATWCGPCLREMPNIRQNLDDYQDRGFSVVSINLDEDREEAEAFLEQVPLPWAVLYSSDPKALGMKDSNAVRNGVAFLPTVLLVGKDGNVLTFDARGEELGKQLERLLGPVEREKPAPEAEPEPE
jgi:thiol-disulfide isomerase/thioredoxin